jgi:hypothetical protein
MQAASPAVLMGSQLWLRLLQQRGDKAESTRTSMPLDLGYWRIKKHDGHA